MLARKLLSEEGWWLSDEGYAELGVDRGSSARDARARALDTNLKRLAADGSALGALRDDAVALAGPLVLQLVDVVQKNLFAVIHVHIVKDPILKEIKIR